MGKLWGTRYGEPFVAAKLNYRLNSKGENRSREENIETNSSYPPPAGERLVGRWVALRREEGACRGTAGTCVRVPAHIWHMRGLGTLEQTGWEMGGKRRTEHIEKVLP